MRTRKRTSRRRHWLLLALSTFGCAGTEPIRERDPAIDAPAASATLAAANGIDPSAEASPAAGPIDLAAALALAAQHHPDVRAVRGMLQSAAGNVDQAGRLPNPSVGLVMESAPFERSPTGGAEYVAGIVQPLALGGRLGAAVDAARADEDAQRAEARALWSRVEAELRRSFAAALHARDVERLAAARRDSDVLLADLARARLQAGDGLADDVLRAEIEVGSSSLELRAAQARVVAARARLESAMGIRLSADRALVLEARQEPILPGIDAILGTAEANAAAVAAAQARVRGSEARVDLARARRFSDVEVGINYRRIEDDEEDAFDVTLGFELPLFDRRAGAIDAAEGDAISSRARLERAIATLRERVIEAYERNNLAAAREQSLEEDLLPRSRSIVTAMETRHRAGEVGIDRVILARQDLWRMERELVDARLASATARADIIELVGN